MHLKRWMTGIVLLPLLYVLVSRGEAAIFAAFVGIVCMISLWEFFRIVTASADVRWVRHSIPWVSFGAAGLMVWAAYLRSMEAMVAIVTISLMVTGVLSLPSFKSWPGVVDMLFKQCLGTIYIPLFLCHLVLIRSQHDGIVWVFLLLSVVFSGDIGALYAGTALGRHKLCPAVSPKKTWEGSIGGLAANLGVGALFKHFFLPGLPWGPMLLLFAVIGIAGQVGDLVESELKRVAGIKDSGVILPGHGGMLDRIDALLFAAPTAYYGKLLLLG